MTPGDTLFYETGGVKYVEVLRIVYAHESDREPGATTWRQVDAFGVTGGVVVRTRVRMDRGRTIADSVRWLRLPDLSALCAWLRCEPPEVPAPCRARMLAKLDGARTEEAHG